MISLLLFHCAFLFYLFSRNRIKSFKYLALHHIYCHNLATYSQFSERYTFYMNKQESYSFFFTDVNTIHKVAETLASFFSCCLAQTILLCNYSDFMCLWFAKQLLFGVVNSRKLTALCITELHCLRCSQLICVYVCVYIKSINSELRLWRIPIFCYEIPVYFES